MICASLAKNMKQASTGTYLITILLYAHICKIVISCAKAHPAEAQPLTNFIRAVDTYSLISQNWTGKDPCEDLWKGVTCKRGFVYSLILESYQLNGTIPNGTLNQLTNLRRISLFNNSLSGPIPDLHFNARALKCIWLHQNSFTGPIPDIFSSTPHLKLVFLSNNKLTGKIPPSLASLASLKVLHLENNLLNGTIPSFTQPSLTQFNVSSNQLRGEIPHTEVMQKMPLSSFGNNPGLCGPPLSNICDKAVILNPSESPLPVPSGQRHSKLDTLAITAIVVGNFLLLMIIALLIFWFYKQKHGHAAPAKGDKPGSKDQAMVHHSQKPHFSSAGTYDPALEAEKSRLVFFNNEMVFDLEDLLRASAELLGKGSFGTAYKAVIERGPEVTVKRLRDLNNLGKKDFEQQMLLIGNTRHPNLVPLRAYYYAKDEKLLVYDYMPNGSLFDLLHGNRGPARNPLDWKARLNIACSVARGLAHLHQEWGAQKLPHGNVKSFNVLMDEKMEARLTDFGLFPLINPSIAAQRMAAFKAPEFHALTKMKVSHKADVYSYGVLLLELLTGKVPASNSTAGLDLPKWVDSVVREEWTSEVFDIELGPVTAASTATARGTEEEMVSLLQVAMRCVDASMEQRLSIAQVQRMVEEISREHNIKPGASSPAMNENSIDSSAGNSSESRYPASPVDSTAMEQGSNVGSSDSEHNPGRIWQPEERKLALGF